MREAWSITPAKATPPGALTLLAPHQNESLF